MLGPWSVGIVLGGSAVWFCYALFFADLIASKIIGALYSGASTFELRLLIPTPTQFALAHSWVFMLPIALLCPATALVCRRQRHPMRCVAAGLGSQALVFWSALFCYSYDGFLGDTSVHHLPTFEMYRFFCVGGFVFPVTFVAVLIAMITTLLSASHQQATPPQMAETQKIGH